MAYFVYIVECSDGTLYTGITTDPARRMREHNGIEGVGASYTRARRPVRLVYTEPATTRSVALQREHALKTLTRPEKMRLIQDCIND